MTTLSAQKRSIESNLINQTADWGVSISEAAAKQTLSTMAFAFGGLVALTLGSMLVIPIFAGSVLFSASAGAVQELMIVAAILVLAYYLNVKAKSGPKNALQIDYDAGEVRLGSINSVGAFVRHKVCPFRQIDEVTVDQSDETFPAICLTMNGEVAKIHFNEAVGLNMLAAKISSAADSAKSAPIRSRIQSKINGIEANVREVGERVRSRVISRIV